MSKIYVLKTFEWDYTSQSEFPQVASTYYHKTFHGAYEHAERLGLTIHFRCINPEIDAEIDIFDLLD